MLKCSFCGDEITSDRYNFWLECERQDFPPSGKWQKLVEHPREDVCSKCFTKASSYIGAFLNHLRKNKGKIIHSK